MNQRPRIAKLLTFLGALFVLVPGYALAALQGATGANVAFTATGPAGMRIVGTTHELRVTESNGIVTVTVPLRNLDTGIALRDSHMKEKYLEVPQFPNAELVVPRSALQIPTTSDVSGDVAAKISIHGQTRDVRFHYEAHKNGARIEVRGRVKVNMRDFGIEVPSYLGITVKPEVNVAVDFNVSDT